MAKPPPEAGSRARMAPASSSTRRRCRGQGTANTVSPRRFCPAGAPAGRRPVGDGAAGPGRPAVRGRRPPSTGRCRGGASCVHGQPPPPRGTVTAMTTFARILPTRLSGILRPDPGVGGRSPRGPGGPPPTDRGDFPPVPDIHETVLPGVGVRSELTLRTGARLGVVAHRHGRRDVVLYDTVDPDAVRESVRLTEAESAALAGLLGGSGLSGDDGGPAPRPGSAQRI